MKVLYLSLICLLISVLVLKAQISVTATAGTVSGTYLSLKAAFDAINNGEHQGDITILVNSSYTEQATARLNAATGLANYTSVHIAPTTTCTISGNIAGALIELNGADSVMIDGRINGIGTERSLTVQNSYSATSSESSTIKLVNGASHNIIRYVNVQGAGQGNTGASIYIASTNNSESNSYNTIDNNDVGPAGTVKPAIGIRSYNTVSAFPNEFNVITNNQVHDFYSTVRLNIGISIAAGSQNTVITGNSVYQSMPVTTAGSLGQQYISVSEGDGYVVSNNFVGGSEPYAGGAPAYYTGAVSVLGISMFVSRWNEVNKIDGNVVGNFHFEHTGSTALTHVAFQGIRAAGVGKYDIGVIEGNTIGSLTKNGDITVSYTGAFNTAGVIGIACEGSINNREVNIQNNKIGSFTIEGVVSGKGFIRGIDCNNLTVLNIENNIIGGPLPGSFQANTADASMQGIALGHQFNNGRYVCRQNIIRNFYNGGSGSLDATITGISCALLPQADNTTSNLFTENQISNLHTANKSATNGSVKGIHIRLYSTTTNSYINDSISNNQISDLKSESLGSSTVVMGIDNECPFNRFVHIASNTIHALSNAAANASAFTLVAVQGIRSITPGDAPVNIIGNSIYDLESTSSAATWVFGIGGLYSYDNEAFTIAGNHIYDLRNDSSQQGGVSGIDIKGSDTLGTFNVINNMISLKPDNVKVYGIVNGTSAANLRMYYNSVAITGTANNNNTSGAFYRTSPAVTNMVAADNIFYNTRSGGSGSHYALMNGNASPATGWDNSNFNNLYSANAATVALWGNSAMSLSEYVMNSNQDSCSKSTVVDFADINNGDLHLVNTNNNKALAGIPVAGISTDIDGDPRHANPSMGADEIEVYLQGAVITASGPTTFCEGGNVILSSSIPSGNQWYKDGMPIAGATSQDYQVEDSGVYYVLITDGCITASSDSIHVIINPLPDTPVIARIGNLLQSSALQGNQWFLDGNLIAGATGQQYMAGQSGVYAVQVTLNGCSATSAPYDFTPCTALITGNTVSNVLCPGTATGAVEVTVNGDEGVLTYAWSNGAQTKDLTDVVAGSYKLIVAAEVGCKDSLDVTITEPPAFVVSETHHDIDCKNYKRGTIDLTVSGGTPPYRYEWSNGATTEDLTNLRAGEYSAVIFDANDCRKEITITISKSCGREESVNLYPNPASNILNLDMSSYDGEIALAIFDLNGNKKLEKTIIIDKTGIVQIDIQQLPPAEYVLKIKTSNGVIKKRFIKMNL